jgi:hypothetical protein
VEEEQELQFLILIVELMVEILFSILLHHQVEVAELEVIHLTMVLV